MGLVGKAKKEGVSVKVSLSGTAGSGKTYSALRLGTGMIQEIERRTGKKKRILVIDTENLRCNYYANEFDFDVISLKERKYGDDDYKEAKEFLPKVDDPYAPENFNQCVKYAVENDYGVVIIDQASSEWRSILDAKNKMSGTNEYVKWGILTPRHDAFIYNILYSPIHVIVNLRSKEDYAIEEENGKRTVKKLGLGEITRDGFSYEMTLAFALDNKTHLAEATKDNTHMFDGNNVLLTEEHGAKLIDWANSDGEITAEQKAKYNREVEDLAKASMAEESPADIIRDVSNKMKAIKSVLTKELIDEIKSVAPEGNPNKIKTLEQAEVFRNKFSEVASKLSE